LKIKIGVDNRDYHQLSQSEIGSAKIARPFEVLFVHFSPNEILMFMAKLWMAKMSSMKYLLGICRFPDGI